MIVLAGIPLFKHPDRQPELVVAVVDLLWGMNAVVDTFMLTDRHTMDGPFFAPLLATGVSQLGWGLFAVAIGIVRLACLWVNGTRPRGSTLFRTIGAGMSGVLWFGFLLGAWQLPWLSGALFTYGGFLALDLLSVIRAGREIAPAYSRGTLADGRF